MEMNIDRVKQNGYLEIDRNQNGQAKTAGNFKNNLEENLAEQTAQKESDVSEQKDMEDSSVLEAACYQMLSAYAYHAVDKASNGAASECEVRNLTYDKCDYAKVWTEKGAVYKAQVDMEKGQVYVEQKKDDGTVTGYLVDMESVTEDTDSAIEQIAVEAWEQEASEASMDTEEAFAAALEKFYVYAEERVKNGPPKFAIGAAELTIEEWDKLMETVDKEIDTAKEELRERVEKEEEEREEQAIEKLLQKRKELQEKGPYSYLMGEDGTITYQGVTFTYDETGALCLGDTSNPDDVVTVYLSSGVFKFNRENVGDLAKAISMFSPEDINRILQAISQDAKCKEKLNEIEETLMEVPGAQES